MDVAERKQIVKTLYDCYKANGFITENEALSLFSAHDIPLTQIDSITAQLLTMGVIITTDDDDSFIDRSFTEYNAIYDEFIEREPEFEQFIEYVRNIIPAQYLEWQRLIPQAQNGNEYAKTRLYEMYMRAAVRQALYYSKKFHLPLDDTLQDALVGVISSVDRYNPAEHANFNSNIQWWITGAITRSRMLNRNPMTFPTNFLDDLFSIMDEVDEHYCEHCPKNEENICSHLAKTIAGKNGWSVEEATKNIHYLVSWKSLDAITENGEDISDDSIFIDELFDEITEFNYGSILMELLETIKPREKEVLLYRNGFTEKGVLTLEEVGEIYGLTRERIRQIEDKALRRMRHHTRSQRLKS